MALPFPDFPREKPPDYRVDWSKKPRGLDAHPGTAPFIMNADGLGALFVSSGLHDGPLPTHYEPVESPIENPLYRQQRNPVFKNWAYAWSRRTIIMNAIRGVFSPGGVNLHASSPPKEDDWKLVADGPLAAVVQLESLERFVFVMSLLEGYSEHECSILLNRSRREIAAARTLALQHLGEPDCYIEMHTRRKDIRAISTADL